MIFSLTTSSLVREMKRPGVTLTVLWEEYRAIHPDGYGYSRFCELFGEFEHRLSPTMRQHHVAGDKVFVDYSGKTIPIVDPTTGEVASAEIFVAVLGASTYTYAEATWSQMLADWIGAHVRMFHFYEGVTRLVVPDFVPGNKIRILCPTALCSQRTPVSNFTGRASGARPHNRLQRVQPSEEGFVVLPD